MTNEEKRAAERFLVVPDGVVLDDKLKAAREKNREACRKLAEQRRRES